MSVTFWLILLFSLCLILALAEEVSITRGSGTEHHLFTIDDSSVENNIVHGKKRGTGSDKRVRLYHHVGCFLDKPVRALSHSGLRLRSGSPADKIHQCALLAFNGGYDTFGVQLGGECFTGPSARHTYGVYGAVSGCINGLGGIWRNDIYFLDMKKGTPKRSLSTGKKRSQLRKARWYRYRYCGNMHTRYNPKKFICCRGKLFYRRRGTPTGCCGQRAYNYRLYFCCIYQYTKKLRRRPGRYNTRCCSGKSYNPKRFICCSGKLLPRRHGALTRCCGQRVYNSRLSFCRSYKHTKKVQRRPGRYNTRRCSGKNYNPKRFICCSGKLLPRSHGALTRCCGQRVYNYRLHFCCRYKYTKKVARRRGRYNSRCCSGTTYNPNRFICCSGKLLPRRYGAFTRCCGQRTYNYRRFICCSGRIRRSRAFRLCCGQRTYDYRFNLCCSYKRTKKVQKKRFGIYSTRCCRTQAYNKIKQKCCRNGLVVLRRLTCSKCAGEHYNPAKRICCGRGKDQVLKSKTFGWKTRCCQNKIYNLRSQKCCNGKIHNTAEYGRFRTICCGSDVYDRRISKCCRNRRIFPKDYSCVPCALENYYDPSKKICCRGKLFKRKYGSSISCCSKKAYDTGRKKCCNGWELIPKNKKCPLPFCGKRRYNESTQICCDGHAILPRIFGPNTGCCVHNRTLAVYHVQKQKCCFGKPIANVETCFPDGTNCTTDMDVSRYICCGHIKRVKSFGENSDCCGDIVYDRVHEICCDGIPSPVNSGGRYECCGTSSYNAKVAKCCIGNKVVPNCGRCPRPK